MKTYRTRAGEDYYNHEVRAFKKLRHRKKPASNVIGFYGSFVRDGTFNVLLEYADKGTGGPFEIGPPLQVWILTP